MGNFFPHLHSTFSGSCSYAAYIAIAFDVALTVAILHSTSSNFSGYAIYFFGKIKNGVKK
jgi:hypothetical protein